MKQILCATISEEALDKINQLVQTLPERSVNGKKQRITKSSIIELYSNIIHNYFTTSELSVEYEMLNVVDGRRKKD